MSRDTFNYQRQATDLVSHDVGTSQTPHKQVEASNCAQINEDMWAETRKRHCESREHLRSLLDRHLKPHQ